jgi:hypothetical protein
MVIRNQIFSSTEFFCDTLENFGDTLSNGHSPQIRRIRANVSNVSSVECIESGVKGWRMSGECIESGLSRVAYLANLANF